MTPPSAISAMKGYGADSLARTVWFNSKNYRLNLMWEGEKMFVRDIHLFDENQESLYLKTPCTTDYCHYWTLPVVDGNVWSNDSVRGAMRFYKVLPDGSSKELAFGEPSISNDGKTLTISVPVIGEDAGMVVTLNEDKADFAINSAKGGKSVLPFKWYAAIEHAPAAELPFGKIGMDKVEAFYKGYGYSFGVKNAVFADGRTTPRNREGALRAVTVTPDESAFSLTFSKKQ